MNWTQLLSAKRFGMEDFHENRSDDRSEFQRDYDRLIFSSPFRRLQNKTQVFPLPGSVFVHNRLTHSLEVACVGRSLGVSVTNKLQQQRANSKFIDEIGSIVSAACLAHDMGNPPFGHSGERAIATFFSEGNGLQLKQQMTASEWKDIICFEGNANAFRLLTHQFIGRRKGGFALTYSTLASIIKYPYESQFSDEKKQKFGFFQSEKNDYLKIATELGIPKSIQNPDRFSRYPLVFLVEAADDICYQIMDMEDAHKLRILSSETVKELFLNFFDEKRKLRIEETLKIVSDKNEQIAYLRSAVIGQLIDMCSYVFVENESDILNGTFNSTLIKKIPDKQLNAYKLCSEVAAGRIYNSPEVLDIELAGYKIILTLLENFVNAVINPEKAYSKQLLMRIPEQYETSTSGTYGKILSILDYISGMTDVYALDLYRKITGMNVPSL